ncbi:cyanophycinase [Desulfovermiculus halophilus]|uniref:cyanophycinase n=1 Tax=Desulfovermiculus halophilus TaxID=339722 RepID=UPI000487AC9C|nr:cyanophycinase [Desulfovermiculus halophilus]
MKKTKGILIIIGGDLSLPSEANGSEDMGNGTMHETEAEIITTFCRSLPGKTSRIEIIPTASEVPEKSSQRYVQAFENLGQTNVGVLDIRTREEAQAEDTVARTREAEGFLFTGGNQLRLTTLLGGTEFLSVLLDRFRQEPVVIAGTSAGAMCMSDTMIYEGSSHEALRKGEVKFSSGFGILDNVIIDTHFVKRGRIGRLFQAVAQNPASLGIGLGEDTGLLITKGDVQEAIGSGLIIVVDGANIRHTNMASISEGELISIENLNVHVMIPGDKYILSEHKFIPAQSE